MIAVPRRCAGPLALLGALATILLAGPGVAPALAASGSGLQVTIVARQCPTYESITANLARNNIQESLKDLGADTAYTSGQPIDPDLESKNQPLCHPLPDWSFTLGTGIRSRAVTGPWGALSIVTNPFGTAIRTKAATPLLDTLGSPTGRQIAGAVTIELTADQAKLASRPSALWIQGGTPADPILDQQFPGEYGFGALRCAIDNLNGDNVEWISYPLGYRHVLCYAYYVKPPPTSGTIIVRKEVDAPAGTAPETFGFHGNISYAPDQSFAIAAGPGSPGSASFYRAATAAADEPWTFREDVPAGWALTSLTCTSATTGSQVAIDGPGVSVRLAAGDTVTCTYVDRLVPPPAGLLLRKVTLGGVGTFGFDVTPETGGQAVSASATTTQQGLAVAATPGPIELPAGSYRIDEHLPASKSGSWKVSGVVCDEEVISAVQPVRLTLAPGQGSVCTYTNTFTPSGSIRILKTTVGAVGTTGFVITPAATARRAVEFRQSATTTREGQAVLAKGSDTSALPLGSYDIQETTPAGGATGEWRLTDVECNGIPLPSDAGSVRITLTAAHPDVECAFHDQFTGQAISPEPPTPGPTPDPDPTPQTDLTVTKTPSARVIRLGGTIDYRLTVHNASGVIAYNVTLVELLASGTGITSVTPAGSHCTIRARFPVCVIGTLAPGRSVTLVAHVRPRRVGRIPNRVVVNTSSSEGSLVGNTAAARVLVLPRAPRFVG
ncbi:MAG TPA: DUF11 domain-containing protein [Solirubrobacteraceae bacterium]